VTACIISLWCVSFNNEYLSSSWNLVRSKNIWFCLNTSMYFLDLGHWDLDFYYYNTMLIGCKHLYKCMCFFQHNKGQYSIINSRGIYASAHYWFLCHWILPHYLAMRSGNWVWVEKGQTSPLWVEVSGLYFAVCSNTFLFAHLCAQQSTSTSTLSPTCHIICCIFMLTGLRCLVAMLYFGECVVVDYILLYENADEKKYGHTGFHFGTEK